MRLSRSSSRRSTSTRLASCGRSPAARCVPTSTSWSKRDARESWGPGDGRPGNLRYSAATVALIFDTLAEVALARDLLRRWYGLELGLAAGDGSGYERTSHETCETLRKNGGG